MLKGAPERCIAADEPERTTAKVEQGESLRINNRALGREMQNKDHVLPVNSS